jgi:hypothetical protein
MVNYLEIAALVNRIPIDTWGVLHEIKQRRPAMMLSELIDYRRRASQQQVPVELLSPKPNLSEPKTMAL